MSESSLFLRQASIVAGGRFNKTESEPFYFPLHKHDTHSEMLLILNGEGKFDINGRTYIAGPGKLLFYHRQIWHQEISTKYPFEAMYVGFRDLEMHNMPPDFFLDPNSLPIVDLGDSATSIIQLFNQCLDELGSVSPESRVSANHLLGLVFVLLSRMTYYQTNSHSRIKPSQEAVSIARRYMEENYRVNINLEKLARIVYVSEYHLAHLFKEEYGISPIQFLIKYRMEVARRYLTTTNLLIKEIGDLVGYRSETSFHNVFKKSTGMTPSLYRNKYGK